MASLNFNNFRNIYKEDNNYTYSDIHFDIRQSNLFIADNRANPAGKDIRMSLDEFAIKNSIINIFNTNQGERFLVPEFGINLRRYLFEPVSDAIAEAIGETILYNLETWEPRIRVDKVIVMARPTGTKIAKDTGKFSSDLTKYLQAGPASDNEYVVHIAISIPILRHRTYLEGILTQEQFTEASQL